MTADNPEKELGISMLVDVQSKLAKAAKLADRNTNEVSLIAVSKQQPEARIDSALEAGLRIFGENRVQEAQGRWQPRRRIFQI